MKIFEELAKLLIDTDKLKILTFDQLKELVEYDETEFENFQKSIIVQIIINKCAQSNNNNEDITDTDDQEDNKLQLLTSNKINETINEMYHYSIGGMVSSMVPMGGMMSNMMGNMMSNRMMGMMNDEQETDQINIEDLKNLIKNIEDLIKSKKINKKIKEKIQLMYMYMKLMMKMMRKCGCDGSDKYAAVYNRMMYFPGVSWFGYVHDNNVDNNLDDTSDDTGGDFDSGIDSDNHMGMDFGDSGFDSGFDGGVVGEALEMFKTFITKPAAILKKALDENVDLDLIQGYLSLTEMNIYSLPGGIVGSSPTMVKQKMIPYVFRIFFPRKIILTKFFGKDILSGKPQSTIGVQKLDIDFED